MHRNTFWRSKRMGQVNIYLPLGRSVKLLIHIRRKLLKTVRVLIFYLSKNISWYSKSLKPQAFWNLPYRCLSLSVPALLQVSGAFQSSSALLEPGYIQMPDSALRSPLSGADISSWTNNSAQTVNLSHGTKGLIVMSSLALMWSAFMDVNDVLSLTRQLSCSYMLIAAPSAGNNCCSSIESTPGARPIGETPDLGNHNHQLRGKALTPPYLYS